MGRNDTILLDPESIDIIFKSQPGCEKWWHTKAVVVSGYSAIDSLILIGNDRTKIIEYIDVVDVMQFRMTLLLVVQVHENVIQSIDVVCPGPKGLRNFDKRAL